MKRLICVTLVLMLVLCGCQTAPAEQTTQPSQETRETVVSNQNVDPALESEIRIELTDEGIYVEDGYGVTVAHDIVYYESGQGETYGEGTEADEHDAAEADAHTVVHISQPGTYRLVGKLSAGQIAVDLGEGAEDDPEAVVTLILDNVDITCTVAPAIIFYRVYECGDADNGTAQVDTTAAGANVVLADGSENHVRGSYVAKIYRPDSDEQKKLHKYDGALYSKMSMNVDGNDGILNIEAENEGLDSELHLTINGGVISIRSGNDGINTNEDGVSVTTVNGGALTILVTGETGEGDGIDSNGYLVINGGVVTAAACSRSMDAGIDSDMGIYLNGGTLVASGSMLDRIAGGDATYAVFSFAQNQPGGSVYTLKNEAGEAVLTCTPENDFSCLILMGDELVPGTYTFWNGETQLAAASGQGMNFEQISPPGGEGSNLIPDHEDGPGRMEIDPPEGDYQIPEQPGMPMEPMGGQGEAGEAPRGEPGEAGEPPQGEPGENGELPQGAPGENGEPPQSPEGQMSGNWETSTDFTIVQGGNQFQFVTTA